MSDTGDTRLQSVRRTVGGYRRRRPVVAAVGFIVLCLIVGGAWARLSNAAFGIDLTTEESLAADSPADLAPVDTKICSPNNPDLVCTPAQMAQEFRNGYFKRSSGFTPANVFRSPSVARDTWATMIVNRIINKVSDAKYLALRNHYIGSTKDPACTDRCLAYRMYDEMRSDASCVAHNVPTNRTGTCYREPNTSITKDGIQNGGALVLCGVLLGAGVVTDGATVFVASVGVVSCGWSFWMNLG